MSMRLTDTPSSRMSDNTRCTSTAVLPLPAAAETSSSGLRASTAACCSGVKGIRAASFDEKSDVFHVEHLPPLYHTRREKKSGRMRPVARFKKALSLLRTFVLPPSPPSLVPVRPRLRTSGGHLSLESKPLVSHPPLFLLHWLSWGRVREGAFFLLKESLLSPSVPFRPRPSSPSPPRLRGRGKVWYTSGASKERVSVSGQYVRRLFHADHQLRYRIH